MLKRVVRRALGARGKRAPSKTPTRTAPSVPPATTAPPTTPPAAPKAAAPEPTPKTPQPKTPPPASSAGSIAARIASGSQTVAMPAVSATSGASGGETEQLNTTDTGDAYWGAIDNESSRAKARGETLLIDQWECISCGTCVENTDAVFLLPDDAKAVVTQQYGDMALVQDAIDACPVTCIHWDADPNAFEQLNDAEGRPTNG